MDSLFAKAIDDLLHDSLITVAFAAKGPCPGTITVDGKIARGRHGDEERTLRRYVADNPQLFRVSGADPELRVCEDEEMNGGGRVVRLQRYYQGVIVFGCELGGFFDSLGTLIALQGTIAGDINIPMAPRISESEAREIAVTRVKKGSGSERIAKSCELQVLAMALFQSDAQPYSLGWKVLVSLDTLSQGFESVLVDATSGIVIQSLSENIVN